MDGVVEKYVEEQKTKGAKFNALKMASEREKKAKREYEKSLIWYTVKKLIKSKIKAHQRKANLPNGYDIRAVLCLVLS